MPPLNPYDQALLKKQAAINKKLLLAYQQSIASVTASISSITLNGKTFSLKDYPQLQKKVDDVIAKMQPQVYATVANGITESWELSNKKNNVLVDKRLAGKKPVNEVKKALYDPNKKALEAYLKRVEKGIDLSDRVWSSLEPFKKELEQGLGIGIGKGQSAAAIAKDLKKYLNDPDKLFRRVRGQDGKLYLSAAARQHKPGQGVYRSSYKNALRLARTETNGAYRTADHERWKNLPFVIGIDVKLSNAHPVRDICDTLAGRYPKDFKFSGWHPQCICFATAAQMSESDYDKLEDAILAGEPLPDQSALNVKQPPTAFSNYVRDNKAVLDGYKTKPYWMQDNPSYVTAAKEKAAAEAVNSTAAGKNISSQLNKKDRVIAQKVDAALQAIDEVHGDGDLLNIPFKKSSSSRVNGTFGSNRLGTPIEITLSTKAIAPEVTVAHEMGHYLDLHAIDTRGKFSSVTKDSPVNKVVAIAKESASIKNLEKLLSDGFIKRNNVEIKLSAKIKQHFRYLVSEKEIWARSYAQFISKRSSNVSMKREITRINNRSAQLGYNYQWPEAEFKDIDEAIEAMMVELGWLSL